MIMGAEQGQRLLDFGQKLDINLLDNVICTMYSGDCNQQKVAQEILTHLKEHPESWTRVDTILEFSNNQQTKYFALQILEHAIKVRWKALPPAQCEGIKKYIVSLIIKISSSQDSMEKEKMYLGKLNIILVQILKKEWPHNWPSFIPEIVGASKTNESLCQNNMIILKLLSEEVFDFSLGQMTQSKIKHLKDQMCKEFMQIFQLCQFVMDNSQNAPLVLVTLETLLKFLSWIPLGYIFETKLITTLIHRFLNVPLFRNTTLKCLTEIAGLKAPQYDEQFVFLYSSTMQQLLAMLPIATNIKDAYASGSDDEQNFIQNLSMFLSTYLKEHGNLIEKNEEMKDILKQGHIYLLLISNVEEIEIFKICLEYWNVLASSLYREKPISTYIFAGTVDMPPRWRLYQEIISELRVIMVSRMARPEEVLVVENDQGEVVREFMKDTDAINLYKNMRETLVYLTHLDYADTERIMLDKLQKQVNRSEWSWKNLNTLCWAIGSISGAMHEEDEKRFLVTVIKDLLYLCEQKRGKDNKAIIASNIMYVVGQYPRFLKAHWKFLKTVVNKLFEFMHETHEGVQDMACDTFIKIAHKCRRHFILIQPGEVQTFVEEILSNISSIICDLQPLQVHTFYEAVGMMIASQTNPQMQESLIQKYMLLPNQAWEGIVEEASKNVDILKDPDTIKQLGNILKTNVKACKSLEHPYVSQLAKIYLDMLNLYHVMNTNISQAVALNGPIVIKQPLVQGMRLIKKETLKLISCWISLSNDPKLVLDNFISPLLEAILVNYKQNLPDVREPEVLVILTTLVNKLGAHVNHFLLPILDAIFESTLSMISSNFEDYPEHRVNFYLFLQAVNVYCSEALLTLPPPQFKLVFDSIIWGIKHTMRNVAETSLDILFTLLKNVEQSKNDTTQLFYQTYFTSILEHLFAVVSDTSLTADLPTQSTILAHMFSLLEQNKITVPLNPNDPAMSAPDYIKDFTSKLLKNAFPHLSDPQINVTIQGFFNLHHDLPAFKDHLRDFLVQIREFSGADDSDLYIAEKEAAIKKAQQDKMKTIMNIPGMIKPSEMSEEMQQ